MVEKIEFVARDLIKKLLGVSFLFPFTKRLFGFKNSAAPNSRMGRMEL